MKGFKDSKKKFHPIKQYKGVRKSRDQSSKFVGIKIARDERARQQLKGAPKNIKICSTCDRSFDIDKQKGKDFVFTMELPQCTDCKRKGVPPLGQRKKRFLSESDIDRLSELEIKVLLKEVETRWNINELSSQDGDHQVIVYTNKSDPSYTFELHPMDDNETEDEDGKELDEPIYHDAWYFFPAKNGKGIPNSPTVISETGGYTRKDAIREFNKELILYDQEFEA